MIPLFRDRIDKHEDGSRGIGRYWSRSVTEAEAKGLMALVRRSLIDPGPTSVGGATLGAIPVGGRRFGGLLAPKTATAMVLDDGSGFDLFYGKYDLGTREGGDGWFLALGESEGGEIDDPPAFFDALLEDLAGAAS